MALKRLATLSLIFRSISCNLLTPGHSYHADDCQPPVLFLHNKEPTPGNKRPAWFCLQMNARQTVISVLAHALVFFAQRPTADPPREFAAEPMKRCKVSPATIAAGWRSVSCLCAGVAVRAPKPPPRDLDGQKFATRCYQKTSRALFNGHEAELDPQNPFALLVHGLL